MLPSLTNTSSTQYFHPEIPQDFQRFSRILTKHLCHRMHRPIILLCIGTDRATGDCLGPLIGQQLSKTVQIKNVIVYGTLEQPVHARNLSQILSEIHNHYQNPYIIAIDASLGVPEHIGFVTLGTGSLRPGAGVRKPLPDTGNIHITGIVNALSSNNLRTLQTTRLATVTHMSDFIAKGLLAGLQSKPPFAGKPTPP